MKRLLVSLTVFVAVLASPFVTTAAGDCPVKYTVEKGDNLYRIALKYGLKWPQLAQANNLANANYIQAGQVLCIPVTPTSTATPTKSGTPSGSPTPTTTKPAATTAAPTATLAPTATPIPTTSFIAPTFAISAVRRDQTVTIKAINFPPNTKFDALMGPMHTQGVGGVPVGATDSGSGSFTATYNIPASLRGSAQISIRLQSKSGYFSYNWFYNNSTK